MPIQFTITLPEKFKMLRESSAANQSRVNAEIGLMLDTMALEARELFVANSPVSKAGSNSGRLKRSWRIISRGADTRVVLNDTPYLKYVMRGHGWIYPKTAKVLRFEVEGGRIVFAARVKPVAPNTFIERSIAEFKAAKAAPILRRFGMDIGNWWLHGR